MANPSFCYPNWTLPTATVTPTITGPGWVDLDLLQGDVLSEMARSDSVDPALTKVVIDMGAMRNIRVLAIPLHNAKLGDAAKMRLATDVDFNDVTLDTGWKQFFGETYPFGSLQWGAEEWLTGQLSVERATGKRPPWMHVEQSDVYGRYLEVSLDFSGNADGFADLGQIIASPAVSPIYNRSYGANPPFLRDPSTKTRTRAGTQFADKKQSYLMTRMQFDWLGENELYGGFFEMVQEYGITKPMFFIWDADAPAGLLAKQSFMATVENISDPVHPSYGRYSLQIEVAQAF
ncbi:hypothetical protein [Herbaspirillum sp. ST 5-3]|uniref:hypothetical protein n=1 Tax=Oxalobacteraceae TaxID=75682 RepID=UPI0010A2F0BE|nr:hypothetical protein [Herbaspirillum sp. ST 5-3]